MWILYFIKLITEQEKKWSKRVMNQKQSISIHELSFLSMMERILNTEEILYL